MHLPADLPPTARDYSDAQLDAVIAHYDMRRQPQPLRIPEEFDYAAHTAECAPDDDGPAGDLRAMTGLAVALGLTAGIVVIALALAVLI